MTGDLTDDGHGQGNAASIRQWSVRMAEFAAKASMRLDGRAGLGCGFPLGRGKRCAEAACPDQAQRDLLHPGASEGKRLELLN